MGILIERHGSGKADEPSVSAVNLRFLYHICHVSQGLF